MNRVCIGVYFSANLPELRQTIAQLRANTPRSAAVLLLADAPDPVTSLELRAFPGVLQLPTTIHQGPAGCFHQLVHASDADICIFLHSGTLVSPDWLAQMLYTLNRDSRTGIVLAGERHNENTVLLVRREVARTIGIAESERADSARWVSGYCQRAKRAGFEILTADLETQHVRLPMTARHARGLNAHQRIPDMQRPDLRKSVVSRPGNAPSWLATSRTEHYRESRTETRVELGSVSVVGHFNIATGYGSMSEYVVRGMSRAGAHVNIVPLTMNRDGLSDEFTDLLRRSRKLVSDPVLFYSWPEPHLQPILSRSETFLYTMWESSRLPNGWAEQINQARAVIVPTRFVAQMFRENGVTSPIEVVPDGVDPATYNFLDRPETAGVTTLIVGPIDNRKNVRKGIASWKEASADDPDARLIIKTQYNYQNYTPDDPRIRYVDVVENSRGISHWYQQADVLLALGSEGFGLPLIEAMATGLPVIALNSEGQADMCEDARDLLLPVAADSWEVYHSGFGSVGLHGVPSVSEVAARLRWVATHRAEAREMGRAASEWVQRHRDVWNKGPAVLDVIERHTHSSRPLRRATVLWTPSWQSPCGIAEYTAYLHECLPSSVKVTAHQPDLRTLRLLHIQHHTGIFREAPLAACVGHARQAGVPVVVTEHAVDDKPRAWERDASAIICPHSLGASKIAGRWPGKRVEHIPHGCPGWYPPRKSTQAKVIGAFGFLADYKGFWQLLQVLRETSGTELLLFSHAKSAEIEARWEKAAAGLPVRRIRDYLQAHEIAERLAAEADILAFWYDDIASYSPSGAVRIGLATGVPVLASPTQWFHDLRDVTYQPTSLVEGLRRLLDDTELRSSLTNRARDYCNENSWSRVAERHVELWRTLT